MSRKFAGFPHIFNKIHGVTPITRQYSVNHATNLLPGVHILKPPLPFSFFSLGSPRAAIWDVDTTLSLNVICVSTATSVSSGVRTRVWSLARTAPAFWAYMFVRRLAIMAEPWIELVVVKLGNGTPTLRVQNSRASIVGSDPEIYRYVLGVECAQQLLQHSSPRRCLSKFTSKADFVLFGRPYSCNILFDICSFLVTRIPDNGNIFQPLMPNMVSAFAFNLSGLSAKFDLCPLLPLSTG